jgi:hypothetical protein
MNGTLIDPLAASHTAGQSYRQKLYAVRGGPLTGPAIPGMAPGLIRQRQITLRVKT